MRTFLDELKRHKPNTLFPRSNDKNKPLVCACQDCLPKKKTGKGKKRK